MTKIAILADFPLSALEKGATGRGGGQGCTWLPQLALSFAAFPSFDIHWIVIDRKGAPAATIEAHGQTFHRIKGVSITADLALSNLPTRWLISRFLKRLKPDIVHAWGTELIYPAALRDFEGATILSMQGVLAEYQRIGGIPNDWRWRRMVAAEPAMIRSATIVTSESEWGISKVREVDPGAECRLVEYGVHPSFYELKWRPDPDIPYALFVGGADKRKGMDVLIEALTLLPDRKWEMRFAGDTAIQAACDAAGLQNIHCLGMLPWHKMQEQLQGAWCAVLPTRGDTSPNSVKEARVIGVPMVTTVHGGQAGYIQDGINGRIVEPLSAEGLAAALGDVMSSHQRSLSLGRGRHEKDRTYLHPRRTAEGFVAIYRELHSRPKSI